MSLNKFEIVFTNLNNPCIGHEFEQRPISFNSGSGIFWKTASCLLTPQTVTGPFWLGYVHSFSIIELGLSSSTAS